MRFQVNFSTTNAAFEGSDRPAEIARILRALADTIEGEGEVRREPYVLRDYNGNGVGLAKAG